MLLTTKTVYFVHANVQVSYSPLYAASTNGHTDVVDLLVRAGADVNWVTKVILTVQNSIGESLHITYNIICMTMVCAIFVR